MTAVVSLLRGVNVGGHNIIRMEALRSLYESLGFIGATTYVQSGNVVFRSRARDLSGVGKRIEAAIERTFGFRPDVILRTAAELRDVVVRNPFAGRDGIEPNKLLVTFLGGTPAPDAGEKLAAIRTDGEELRLSGRELFVYFPNGMGRSKLSPGHFERLLKTPGTGRNWNTVVRLLEMAEATGELRRAARGL
jgi:uncharacterized protein (DUF1697 family)